MGKTTVKRHTRRSSKGKIYTVRQHTRHTSGTKSTPKMRTSRSTAGPSFLNLFLQDLASSTSTSRPTRTRPVTSWQPAPTRPAQPLARVRRERQARTARLVCNSEWQAAISRNAARSMSQATWRKRPVPCTARSCKDFAAVAKSLEGFQGRMHRMVGRLTGDTWAAFAGDGSFGRRVAYEIGSRLPVSTPLDQAFASAALCLRTMGIMCCIASDRPMEQCDCLFDFGKGVAEEELQGRLQRMALTSVWPVAV